MLGTYLRAEHRLPFALVHLAQAGIERRDDVAVRFEHRFGRQSGSRKVAADGAVELFGRKPGTKGACLRDTKRSQFCFGVATKAPFDVPEGLGVADEKDASTHVSAVYGWPT